MSGKRVPGGSQFDEKMRELCDRYSRMVLSDWEESFSSQSVQLPPEVYSALNLWLSDELFTFQEIIRSEVALDPAELRATAAIQRRRESVAGASNRARNSVKGRLKLYAQTVLAVEPNILKAEIARRFHKENPATSINTLNRYLVEMDGAAPSMD